MGHRDPLSRRAFGLRAAGLSAGLTATALTERALAQLSYAGEPPAGAVLLNANENPLGPCAEAMEAMTAVLKRGGRYLFGEVGRLGQTFAQLEGLRPEQVQAFAGSSDPLHRIVLAFCGPERCFVKADPGYEAGEWAARNVKARVHQVPLTKDYAHDVDAMLAAGGPNAGVFYLCNPNNPTGTLTPRAAIERLVEKRPAGSIVLIDEAYIHFADTKPCLDLATTVKDVVVLRTFSKIYGMAGLRAGLAIARPNLLEKLRFYGSGFLPATGMAGAAASLRASGVAAERKKYVREIREDIFQWMRGKGYSFVPSVSNKFMVDVKRPGREVMSQLAAQNVYIGRSWPVWPTHVRVTIGTGEEMERFKTAFARVMA
jgi:histidinol-phosphate aminotransferase